MRRLRMCVRQRKRTGQLGRATLLALGCASLLLAAASAGTARPKVAPLLVEGIPFPEISTLDPDIQGGNGEYLDPFILDYLMKLSPNGQVEPNLAQSVTQPSKASYVYHLRHGVKFWDGTEMTSADVANALNYARYPTMGTRPLLASVKAIKTTSKYTVLVTLKHPDAGFPCLLTHVGSIFEKKQQQANRNTFGQPGTLLIGTGPYRISSWNPTQGITFTLNPTYWGKKPPVQKVEVRFFSSEQSIALAFRAGQVDVAFPADAAGFASTAGTKVISVPSAEQGLYSMDIKAPYFSDIHVRRAISYAIDRVGIINSIGGHAIPDYTTIPPVQLNAIAPKAQVDALIDSLQTYRYNLAKAKQEMAQSAYPDGFTTSLDTFQYGNYVVTDEAIAGMLAKIGITLKVNVLPVSAAIAEYTQSGFNDAYTYFYSEVPDPGLLPSLLYSSKEPHAGGANWANFQNAKVDALLQEGDATMNGAKRFAVYAKLLRIVQPLALYVPLYQGDNNLAISRKFSLPTFGPYTTDHSTQWILDVVPE